MSSVATSAMSSTGPRCRLCTAWRSAEAVFVWRCSFINTTLRDRVRNNFLGVRPLGIITRKNGKDNCLRERLPECSHRSLGEHAYDPLGALAVPLCRNLAPAAAFQLLGDSFANSGRLYAAQYVGARRDRHRAFGVFSYRDARDAQAGGFFLDPARISNHQLGELHQAMKIQIATRRNHSNSGAKRD